MLGLHGEMHLRLTSRHESTLIQLRIAEKRRLVVPQGLDDPLPHNAAVLGREDRKLVQGRLEDYPIIS